jgi:hypothetical protein
MQRLITATATLLAMAAPAVAAAKQPAENGPDWCAKAQNVHANPNSRIVQEQTACYARAGAGAVRADFDGDGFGDLAIGVPDENFLGQVDSGIVQVVYGSAGGLGPRNQVVAQSAVGPGSSCDTSESGDRFGSALAGGDFNGDGLADLAVGVPFEDAGTVVDAGIVCVYYGSPTGILLPSQSGIPVVWTQNSAGVPDASETGDQFGFALAWGNFSGGPEAELAIGAPGESLEGFLGTRTEAGAVTILNGAPAGLTGTGSQQWTQDSTGILDQAENFDRFGTALSAANLGALSRDDLAIGVPLEDVSGKADGGAVHVIYGSGTAAGGLSATDNQFFTQDSTAPPVLGQTPQIEDVVETGDHFGAALAATSKTATSDSMLAIGVPLEDFFDLTADRSLIDAGAVAVLYGRFSDVQPLSINGDQLWERGQVPCSGCVEMAGFPADGDRLGTALAAGDMDGNGHKDLAMGAPFADVINGQVTIPDAGSVNVAYRIGSGHELRTPNQQLWSQDTGAVAESAGTGDRFGSALAAWDFGRTPQADLAIGVPFEDLGDSVEPDPANTDAGAMNVLYGSATGLTDAGNQLLFQGPPLGDVPGHNDHFGAVAY